MLEKGFYFRALYNYSRPMESRKFDFGDVMFVRVET